MSCECEENVQETTTIKVIPLTTTTTTANPNVVFEVSTQTPTTETCESSPLFSQKGYCLKTDGHSFTALNNIHKMKQHGQVTFDLLLRYPRNLDRTKVAKRFKHALRLVK